ncbi:unnamed protein product [Owenia fusiformis]|uniref:Uncharacterized protein n=1 Tax=Owenia fusiformis TaxID=6347 RepID=A0A8J1T846_OWEFU|nr:unnamed protein product [Owenia fusiformis]
MADLQIRQICERLTKGDLECLPKPESSIFRIFLSSTFTDMTIERNELMQKSFPVLKNYCRKLGYDFQVADMRWGVRDDAQDDHQTTALCLKEIKNCQKISKGINFVAFLGNRYGTRPMPNEIPAGEFNTLTTACFKLQLDVSLLHEWYKLDENAVPSVYLLQTISSKLQYYNDDDPNNSELKQKDRAEWADINDRLTRTLRAAANKAYKEKNLDPELGQKYFISVTEQEIVSGLLEAEDVNTNVLCYIREFDNININHTKAVRFVDLTEEWEPDGEAQYFLAELKDTKIPDILSNKNITTNLVDWQPIGIDENHEKHVKYLEKLTNSFTEHTKRLIDGKLSEGTMFKVDNRLYTEILHHLHFCSDKIQIFCGREEILNEIKACLSKTYENKQLDETKNETKDEKKALIYNETPELEEDNESDEDNDSEEDDEAEKEQATEDKSHEVPPEERDFYKQRNIGVSMQLEENAELQFNAQQGAAFMSAMENLPPLTEYNKPIVIHGQSGSGKTALVAKVHQLIPKWLGSNCVRVIRFLGTSAECTNIKETLLSIIAQIIKAYDLDDSNTKSLVESVDSISEISQIFNWIMRKISPDKPLVIILDSLDQLSSQGLPHHLHWLPPLFPTHVHIILSCFPDNSKYNFLASAKKFIEDPNRFIEIPALEYDTASEILDMWLKDTSRTITAEQNEFILEIYKKHQQPLFLKLLFHKAALWKSYTRVYEVRLGHNVRQAIDELFEDLEKKHGTILVQKALGYLTASKSGLSETEMEDVLSLSDEVLQDTYLYHLPPNEKLIHLPPLLWTRIVNDIGQYFVTRKSDDETVNVWYHRQFHEAARERYLRTSLDSKNTLHVELADYFKGTWGEQVKPLELYKVKKGVYPDADRKVSSQPLQYSTEGVGLFNKRKMSELPYHLVHSKQLRYIVEEIVCNFDWLYCRCVASGIGEILNDIKYILSVIEEEGLGVEYTEETNDIEFIHSLLLLSKDVCKRNVKMLAVQIIGRLGTSHHKNYSKDIKSLIEGAKTWLASVETPMLVPSDKCMFSPGMLVTMFNMVFTHPGDPTPKNVFFFNKSSTRLISCEFIRNRGSLIHNQDLSNYGATITSDHIKSPVRALKFMANERYVHHEIWDVKDKYDPKTHDMLLDTTTQSWLSLPTRRGVVSEGGRFIAFYGGSKADPSKDGYVCILDTMRVAFSLKDQGKTLLVLFSADEKYLVARTKDVIHIWSLERQIRLHTIGKDSGEYSFYGDPDFSGVTFLLADYTLVFPKMGYSNEGTLTAYNIETGKNLFETESEGDKDGHYGINIICFDSVYKRVATASSSGGIVNGIRDKPVSVWNMQNGKLMSLVKQNKWHHNTIVIAGTNDQFLLSTPNPKGHILIHYIGTFNKPCSNGVLVYTLTYHSEVVFQIGLTADSTNMVTAGRDNVLRLWNWGNIEMECNSRVEELGERITEVEAYPEDTMCEAAAVVLSSQYRLAIIALRDGTILFHDVDSNEMENSIKLDLESVSHMILADDGQRLVVTGSYSKKAMVVNINTREVDHVLISPKKGSGEGGNSISCVAEHNGVCVIGQGGMACYGVVWDINTGRHISTMEGLYGFGNVTITQDATKVITTFFEFPMVFNVSTGETESDMDDTDVMMSGASCVVLSPGDRYCAVGSSDGSVRVMDIATRKYKFKMQHKSSVKVCEFTNDNQALVTAAFCHLLVWNLNNGQLMRMLTCHTAFINDMISTLGGRCLVTSGEDHRIVIWNKKEQKSITIFEGQSRIDLIAVSKDMSYIAFVPNNISHMCLLKPNKALGEAMGGQHEYKVPKSLIQAQAYAMAFSGLRVQKKTSQACCII